MRDFWDKLRTWQKITIFFAPVIILVIIAIILTIVLNPGINVKISFSEKTNIPSSEMERVREKLMTTIRSNTADFNTHIIYEGEAREYNESEAEGTTTANFIVDFDSVQESYLVSVFWPNTDIGAPNIIISCPLFNFKYPSTICNTESNSSLFIDGYLPYIGKTDSGKKYKLDTAYDKNKNMYLAVQVELGESDVVIKEALDAAKKWVESIGFEVKDFTFKATRGEISDKILFFYNDDILTMAYNSDFTKTVEKQITNVVFSEEEMKFSKDNNPEEYDKEIYYDATIDAGGFSSYTDYKNGFDVKISDNRMYKVITKTDSFDKDFTYVYSALLREGGDKIFVMVNGAENDKDAFVDFVKQKLGKDKVEVAVLNEI